MWSSGARIATQWIGLLNIYTDDDLEFCWKRASELWPRRRDENKPRAAHPPVGSGILEVEGPPPPQLNRKRGIIIDDEGRRRGNQNTNGREGEGRFLEGPRMLWKSSRVRRCKQNFAQKGLLRRPFQPRRHFVGWKTGPWDLWELKNGMYLDGAREVGCGGIQESVRWTVDGIWVSIPSMGWRWEQNSHAPWVPSPWWTVSPHSHHASTNHFLPERRAHIRMNSTKPASRNRRPRVMANRWWCPISLTPDWGRLRDGAEWVHSHSSSHIRLTSVCCSSSRCFSYLENESSYESENWCADRWDQKPMGPLPTLSDAISQFPSYLASYETSELSWWFVAGQITRKRLIVSLRVGRGPIGFLISSICTPIFRFIAALVLQIWKHRLKLQQH